MGKQAIKPRGEGSLSIGHEIAEQEFLRPFVRGETSESLEVVVAVAVKDALKGNGKSSRLW